MRRDLRSTISKCNSVDEAADCLRGTDLFELAPREVDIIARHLEKLEQPPDVSIAYLGNHTIDPLQRYVSVSGVLNGIRVRSYLGSYNQHYQEIMTPGGKLAGFAPEIIFLSLCMNELSPAIHGRYLELDNGRRLEELDRILAHVGDWAAAARERTGASLVISNFPRPVYLQAGIADSALDPGEAEFYLELNLRLIREYRSDRRVHILDMDRILSRVGRVAAFDPKMYWIAKMLWSESAMPHIADEVLRVVLGIRGAAKKCLVLDLDNTLWGGVVGEEGVAGIRIGPGSPEGEAYLAFQNAIRSLRERGIILAVCSKNNPEDVHEAFEKRTDMALSLDDFAVTRINWAHKHDNLVEIAAMLNIGTDSMVFIDDNPTECELIRQLLPEVKTVLLPGDPSRYADILRDLPDFEKLQLTTEDKDKTRQYHDNAKREEHKKISADITSYLEDLGTEVRLEHPRAEHLSRVHQLFSKTNQFNLTTRRYSMSDVEKFIDAGDLELVMAEVSDRFGSLGIVGLYLIRRIGRTGVIDSFLLSCRAMGRGVEVAMMNKIKSDYLKSNRLEQLTGEFIPTAKNAPAESFYPQQGFRIYDNNPDKSLTYVLFGADMRLAACSGIKIIDGEEH